MQGTHCPPEPTLEPSKELPEPTVMWTASYEQLLIEQQKAAWFMGGSSMMNGLYALWKTALRPVDCKSLIEESKKKLAQCAKLYVAFLVVTEQLSSGNNPYIWVFTDSWAVANGLRQEGNRNLAY